MIRYILCIALASLCLAAAPAKPDTGQFIVHEWGTFTSFAGSDGISLEFRPLVTSDLPNFVFDRALQAKLFTDRYTAGDRSYNTVKGRTYSLQRMETPVTYFYTDRERTVDVEVTFPHGLLTEFYPPVNKMVPIFQKDRVEPLSNSSLTWAQVKLIPPAMAHKPELVLPSAAHDEHYAYARETDSAFIASSETLLSRTWVEKFLFYRGVGNFALPISMQSQGDGRFVIHNGGKDAISAAFLVQVKNGKARFSPISKLGRETTVTLGQTESSLDALADAMVDALVADGLYTKEARAMVKTWRSDWFAEDGTRLLYLLPQRLTDQMIPLSVTPKPDATVRVMVGRLESLTPEQESQITSLIIRMGSPTASERDQASQELMRLGRFAEPALNRVIKTSDDPEIRARARELVAKMRK